MRLCLNRSRLFFTPSKHRGLYRGYKCDYHKQINEELLDKAVIETISNLVNRDEFATFMQNKIKMKVDVSELEEEIKSYEKHLKQNNSQKEAILSDISNLDLDDSEYEACFANGTMTHTFLDVTIERAE